jgi:hypothetical protein
LVLATQKLNIFAFSKFFLLFFLDSAFDAMCPRNK